MRCYGPNSCLRAVAALNRIAGEAVTTPTVVAIGLTVVFLLYATVTDRPRAATRDWLHWLGAGILAADVAESVSWLVAGRLGIGVW